MEQLYSKYIYHKSCQTKIAGVDQAQRHVFQNKAGWVKRFIIRCTCLLKRYGSNGKKESSWFMKDKFNTARLDVGVATGNIILLFCSMIV